MKPPADTAEATFAALNMDHSERKLDKSRVINPHLVLLKATLFLIFGAFSSLVPYLTVHMQSLGLTVGEIATVYLTLLFTTCLCPPISGYIVDRFGQYKPVLMVCLVLNIVAHHSLDLIPRRQPFELIMVQPRLSFTTADKGSIYLDQPCSQAECPNASLLQLKLCQHCSIGNHNNTLVELMVAQVDNSNRSCGLAILDECTLGRLENNSHPVISVQCKLSNEYDGTFWYYLLIRFGATTMLTATVTIVDPMALTMVEQHGGDFGREKLFSSLGMAIFTPLTGLLIDYFSEGHSATNYQPAFYTYDTLMALSLISVLFLPIGQKLPSENIMKHLCEVLQHPHVLVFIMFLFFMGSFWGFIESYMFVIMKEMGSPNYLLGLTYTVGTATSIPMMYLTNPITKKVGHVNLLVVAFFAHALRILGYSFIHNPFWCFPIELNEAISCYFMWVVATTYCAVLAPNSLVATLIGVAGMAHFCLGKGVGSFAGGYLIAQFGTRMGFRYMGFCAIGCGLVYKFMHLVWLKRYDKHQVVETEDRKVTVKFNLTKD
ncbi:uncharacterized protein LOC129727167 [Wyeomyia smithii]|uniref:uncharacterized protein LOC129727167 n=1 Tax=Wyeomyia smithii TaxID=174621 RepID=UPI00246802D5|nr:uncharacterized protein LOC129727167 [Wyeomyia smithii]